MCADILESNEHEFIFLKANKLETWFHINVCSLFWKIFKEHAVKIFWKFSIDQGIGTKLITQYY